MIRVGVFGGRFDPPHIAHFIHTQLVFEAFNLDKILFVPSACPPHKEVHASFKDRLSMLKLAAKGIAGFEVSDIESQEGFSFTIDTLNKLKALYPDSKLFLIIGQDEYDSLNTWREPEKIGRIAELIVLPRVRKEKPESKQGVSFPQLPLINISSTSIRERIAQGKTIRYLVPDTVEAYIKEKQLYKESL
ncbi:nicotinate (nicotinamide) nucleotide adenylyltransferase [candidate division WOR-3 bacterium]|nr:nicotinate (nicotinamide) nucleotide adenylyltransferase [candidate division WOR-3 bacterium]